MEKNTPEQIAHLRKYLKNEIENINSFGELYPIPRVKCYDHDNPNHHVRIDRAYKCLECSAWLCQECAIKHFGYRLDDLGRFVRKDTAHDPA